MTKYSYNSSTKYKITIEAENQEKADSIFKELFDRFIKFNLKL